MQTNTEQAKLLRDAQGLMPLIRDHAEITERQRGLPRPVVSALTELGLFRTLLPRRIGGLECDPMTALATMRVIAQADASTGWCVMIGATAGLSAGWLEHDIARQIHGDPGTVTGGVFAPMGRATVDGDLLHVEGRWAWFSGHQHCKWLGAGCLIMDGAKPRLLSNGQPDSRLVFFPIEQAELLDGWHVSGLCGTGSGEIRVQGLQVPWAQSVSLLSDAPCEDGPLYRMPPFGLLAQGIAAVMIGNARGAIDDLIDLAGAKRPQGSRRHLADRASTQAEVARCHGALRAAQCSCEDAVARLWERLCTHGDADDALRADVRVSATWATRTAADVVRSMYDLGGGSSVFLDCPLQRRFRDAHVGTQHMMIAPSTYELAGKVLMEMPADTTML